MDLVLSPSTAQSDRVIKRPLYQQARVAEYWIVDVDARLIERWTPDNSRGEQLTETLAWKPAGATEPLVIDLVAFFERVHGTRVIL